MPCLEMGSLWPRSARSEEQRASARPPQSPWQAAGGRLSYIPDLLPVGCVSRAQRVCGNASPANADSPSTSSPTSVDLVVVVPSCSVPESPVRRHSCNPCRLLGNFALGAICVQIQLVLCAAAAASQLFPKACGLVDLAWQVAN